MEDNRRERLSVDSIERYLECVEESTFLQFIPGGYKLFRNDLKEGSRRYQVEIGNWSETYKDADKDCVLINEAADISSIYSPDDKKFRSPQDDIGTVDRIDDVRYERWKRGLFPTPEMVVRAAEQELRQRGEPEDDEELDCYECKGEATIMLDCDCILQSWIDSDEDFDEDEETVLRAGRKSLIDPNCQDCRGEGEHLIGCPCCQGSGKMAKYPVLALVNEITGVRRELKLDLVTLIASGEVGVEWTGREMSNNSGLERSTQDLQFNVSPYIYRNLDEIGVDPASYGRMVDNQIQLIYPEDSNIRTLRYSWKSDNGLISPDYGREPMPRNPVALIDRAQTLLADRYAGPEGGIVENDLVIGQEWLMRPLRPTEQTIQDLVTVLDRHHLTLGLTAVYISPAQADSAFYILDRAGTPLYPLSVNNDVREALENAWLELQGILFKAFDSD